jgi:hypothetical protein
MELTFDLHEWPGRLISESDLLNACCTLEPAGKPILTSRPYVELNIRPMRCPRGDARNNGTTP